MADYGTIKVNTDELKVKGEDAWNKIRRYRIALDQIEKAVNSSSSYWQGNAADLYRSVLKKQINMVEDTLIELQKYPEELLAYAGVYSETISKTEETAESINDFELF